MIAAGIIQKACRNAVNCDYEVAIQGQTNSWFVINEGMVSRLGYADGDAVIVSYEPADQFCYIVDPENLTVVKSVPALVN